MIKNIIRIIYGTKMKRKTPDKFRNNSAKDKVGGSNHRWRKGNGRQDMETKDKKWRKFKEITDNPKKKIPTYRDNTKASCRKKKERLKAVSKTATIPNEMCSQINEWIKHYNRISPFNAVENSFLLIKKNSYFVYLLFPICSIPFK